MIHHPSQQHGPLVRVRRQASTDGEPRYEVHCAACGLVAEETLLAFATTTRDRHWHERQAGKR